MASLGACDASRLNEMMLDAFELYVSTQLELGRGSWWPIRAACRGARATAWLRGRRWMSYRVNAELASGLAAIAAARAM